MQLISLRSLLLIFVFPLLFACRAREQATTTTQAPDTALATDPAAQHVVNLGYLRIGSDLPFFVGRETGIFAKHGLKITEHRLADSNQVSDALVKGEIDASDVIGSAVVLKDATKNPGSIKAFLVAAAGPQSNIHQLVVTPASGIQSYKDLAGKRLGLFPGTQMRVYTQLFLGKFLTPAQLASIKLVPLTPPQQVQAFKEDQIEAVLTLEPTGTELVEKHGARRIGSNVLFENISKPTPFVTSFGVIRSDWAQKNPAAAAALIDAYREVAKYISTKPEESKAIMARALNLDPALAAKTSIYDYKVVPDVDVPAVDYTIDLMLKEKALDQDIEAQNLLYAAQP
jgi:NitT/TauT family transport system substrate-binding protein